MNEPPGRHCSEMEKTPHQCVLGVDFVVHCGLVTPCDMAGCIYWRYGTAGLLSAEPQGCCDRGRRRNSSRGKHVVPSKFHTYI